MLFCWIFLHSTCTVGSNLDPRAIMPFSSGDSTASYVRWWLVLHENDIMALGTRLGRLTCVIAEKEKSTSEILSLLSTIRERLLLAKSASLKVNGYLLHIKKSTPMSSNYSSTDRKNSVHLNRAGAIEINV